MAHLSRTMLLPFTCLVCLLSWSSVDAFHYAGVTKTLNRGSLSSQNRLFQSDFPRPTTELVNQNALCSENQKPSVTFYRFPSDGPSCSSTSTRLSSFQIRSIFRSPEVENDTRGAPHSSTVESSSTSSSNSIRTLLTAAPQSAFQSLASLQVTSIATRKIKGVSDALISLQFPERLDQILTFCLQYWWTLPTFLALVPLYTTYVLGSGDATMPHWWPVTRMDHIVSAPDAAMVVGFFLLSNIAYFLSGAFLVKKFPFIRPESTVTTTTISSSTAANSAVSAMMVSLKTRVQALKVIPTRQTWLGLLLLTSGIISTVFHTEQALGSYAIANSLCYLDHAIAGTSTFYFFHTCGTPSKKVLCLGLAGLAALSIPHPAYAWLHSAWHFLSAAAAVLWALETFDSDRQQQSSPMVKAVTIQQDLDIEDSE